MKQGGFQRDFTVVLSFGNLKLPRFENYLCMNCGYFESYITNLNDMKDIPAKWTKVGK